MLIYITQYYENPDDLDELNTDYDSTIPKFFIAKDNEAMQLKYKKILSAKLVKNFDGTDDEPCYSIKVETYDGSKFHVRAG